MSGGAFLHSWFERQHYDRTMDDSGFLTGESRDAIELRLLRFLRTGGTRIVDPEDYRVRLNREQVQARVLRMIHLKINRAYLWAMNGFAPRNHRGKQCRKYLGGLREIPLALQEAA